jgi:ATP-dependent 26S proteasome regulatory subunit
LDDESEVGGEDEERTAKAWRVLVLEDTGELLTADAKVVIGQGLSRFLNVVDGLIGQGLRVLVLVTTNEPIRKLHPAVARPGRCAANVEFAALNSDEASDWLAAHDVADGAGASMTLAELYARAEGRDASETRLVGFAEEAR